MFGEQERIDLIEEMTLGMSLRYEGGSLSGGG
jgi:hypothetical protein